MRKPVRGIENNRILTPAQLTFLKEFIQSNLRQSFRLTGGTALSAFYMEHRFSEDLDFFSREQTTFHFINDSLKRMTSISETTYTKQFDRNMFHIKLKDASLLKVEFTYYPLRDIEAPYAIEGLQIDSFLDILVNKLCAIADRMDAKDYVDVYYALEKYKLSLSRLIEHAERKCEIKGIRHILKNRLLQVPKGINNLQLRVEIRAADVETLFRTHIKKMVEKELAGRHS